MSIPFRGEWVSVSEGLPEVAGWYLIAYQTYRLDGKLCNATGCACYDPSAIEKERWMVRRYPVLPTHWALELKHPSECEPEKPSDALAVLQRIWNEGEFGYIHDSGPRIECGHCGAKGIKSKPVKHEDSCMQGWIEPVLFGSKECEPAGESDSELLLRALEKCAAIAGDQTKSQYGRLQEIRQKVKEALHVQ